MPPSGRARSRTPPDKPSEASKRTAPGFSVSPHNLSRGNSSRSIRSTRAPARAATNAAIEPAGPAPAIKRSSIDLRYEGYDWYEGFKERTDEGQRTPSHGGVAPCEGCHRRKAGKHQRV